MLLSSILSLGTLCGENRTGTSYLPCCCYPRGAKVESQSQEAWLSPEAGGPGLRLILLPFPYQGAESSGLSDPHHRSCGFSRKPTRLVTPTSHISTPFHHRSDTFWAPFICMLGESTAWMAPALPTGGDLSMDIHVLICVDFSYPPTLFPRPQECSQDGK